MNIKAINTNNNLLELRKQQGESLLQHFFFGQKNFFSFFYQIDSVTYQEMKYTDYLHIIDTIITFLAILQKANTAFSKTRYLKNSNIQPFFTSVSPLPKGLKLATFFPI
jgi:hypothetical protein